jgi:hypothetical protein
MTESIRLLEFYNDDWRINDSRYSLIPNHYYSLLQIHHASTCIRSRDFDAPDIIHFLDGVNDAKHSTKTLRTILLQDQYRDKWAALTAFFLRKWWTRVWTIQEFVIPENVKFWYGPRCLTRVSILAALCMEDRCNAPGFKDSIAFHPAFNRRRAWLLHESARTSGKDVSLPLLALIAYFCDCEATNDHDRMYGLTGLCREDHGIDIDYATSVDDTYFQFTKAFVTKHKSLDMITFASMFVATPGSSTPSWLLDWRTRRQPLGVPLMASQSATDFRDHIGKRRNSLDMYSACFVAKMQVFHEPGEVHVFYS